MDSATSLINSLFFEPRRYDLARVGRYKYNKKLALARRIAGYPAAEDVVDPMTGEVILEKDATITRDMAERIQNAGINEVSVNSEVAGEVKAFKVIGNNFVRLERFLESYYSEWFRQLQDSGLELMERVHLPTFLEEVIGPVEEGGLPFIETLKQKLHVLIPKYILVDDIVSAANYQAGLFHGIGETDDIDHLGNRRLRSVGELLQNQIRVGLARLERVVKERMAIQDLDKCVPGPDQHSPGDGRHQGVFRKLPIVPVHGPAQPPGRADPQATPFRSWARRFEPGPGQHGSPGRALFPLRPHLSHRDP